MEALLPETKKSILKRLYLIFIVLEKQELILLGHEIYAAIPVEVWDFQMPNCWGLKFFHKFLQNLLPPSVPYLMTAPSGLLIKLNSPLGDVFKNVLFS